MIEKTYVEDTLKLKFDGEIVKMKLRIKGKNALSWAKKITKIVEEVEKSDFIER